MAVVTNPDQPAGRGYDVQASDVKKAALDLHLSVLQPESAKDPKFIDAVKAMQPDVVLVVAYGKLLPKALLETAKQGFLNVHFSLLPKYRGAAPIQWALIQGEVETGVTLFWLDEGMDTGPVCVQKKIAIGPTDNADVLREQLVPLGISTLGEILPLLEQGKKTSTVQQGEPSKAPILKKEDGHLRWDAPADVVFNRIRGVSPWPGAYAFLKRGDQQVRIKILGARVVLEEARGNLGAVVRVERDGGFLVKCQENLLLITELQPEGKKAMSAWDYWQGARLQIGDTLS